MGQQEAHLRRSKKVPTAQMVVTTENAAGESFRERIARHREAGTCHICGQPVENGQAIHGVTGAHWDCNEREDREAQEVFERVDEKLGGVKPVRKRCREGEGKTAQRAKALAVSAIEIELGALIYDVKLWNQQGIYRGPRWDLDVWGLSFKFRRDGYECLGSASSLATMTESAKAKKLRAVPDDVPLTYSLYTD